MSNDENTNTNQNEANTAAQETLSRENETSEQIAAKFPEWDILPPHSFINPRTKKAN